MKKDKIKYMKSTCFSALFFVGCVGVKAQTFYHEQYRPQIHFSPKEKWMNDPNGMVFYKGVYHLFFQYYPDSTVWGPMHWGHATSSDLVHWKQQPVALYPDSLGYIFSGSVVVDKNNTTGFGKNGKTALVAIFTSHNKHLEEEGKNNFQNQSLAFSLDDGESWTKYSSNPVLKNPGITDFRDPKVMWFEAGKKWIMTLATKDHVTFYSSINLKDWVKESEFGNTVGAHGGVWECPDLFSLNYKGKKVWVLLVSINPGGPNGGSATQYFTGQFDGKSFTAFQSNTRWLDYGKDNYAGVTWSNTGNRKIFIGWMSNWGYANVVPTIKWRSANTIPRDLGIQEVAGHYYVTSRPAKELDLLTTKTRLIENVEIGEYDLSKNIGSFSGTAMIKISSDQLASFSFTLSNDLGEKIIAGYDKISNQYYVDRTQSGNTGFEGKFPGRYTAPRLSAKASTDVTLVIDQASIELFADGGLSVMTDIFFPNKPYDQMQLKSPGNFLLKTITYTGLESIWGQ